MKQKNWTKIIKPIFIILLIISTIPSIIYLIQNKTILNFNQYFNTINDTDRLKQTLIYIIIFAIITTLYVLI